MKKNFEDYLNEIGASGVVMKSVEDCLNDLNWLYPSIDFDDIFINTKMEDGRVAYSSLWLFNNCYVVECKSFMNQKDYDLVSYVDRLQYVNTIIKDYSEGSILSERSFIRIYAMFTFGDVTGEFLAVNQNCDFLVQIAKKYLYTNVK